MLDDTSGATRLASSLRALGMVAAALLVTLTGCEDEQAAVEVERLPDIKPDLPPVPKLPPPPHPVTYEDGSYSVYGVRKRMRNTIDNELEVTGYIVKIYQPPECPKGEVCDRPLAPHMWIADTEAQDDAEKQLLVVGYADNQAAIDEAVAKAKRGQYKPPDPETGIPPIPTDFALNNEVRVKGRFTRISGNAFNASDGLLEYMGHETLVAAESE